MSSYNYTVAEKAIVDLCKLDAELLAVQFKEGHLSLPAFMAANAAIAVAKATPKDALAIVELADGGHITFKISEKQAISAYGVGGKWPVTLYAAGWQRLLEALAKCNLPALIAANKDKLAWKAPKEDNGDSK
jgi:hypothetical protein